MSICCCILFGALNFGEGGGGATDLGIMKLYVNKQLLTQYDSTRVESAEPSAQASDGIMTIIAHDDSEVQL